MAAGVLGSVPTVFSLCFHARAHSWHRKVFFPALSCGSACLPQSGCSQLPHFATDACPPGFLCNKPGSTVHTSMASPLEGQLEIAELIDSQLRSRLDHNRTVCGPEPRPAAVP